MMLDAREAVELCTSSSYAESWSSIGAPYGTSALWD